MRTAANALAGQPAGFDAPQRPRTAAEVAAENEMRAALLTGCAGCSGFTGSLDGRIVCSRDKTHEVTDPRGDRMTNLTESQLFTLRLCDEVPGGVAVNTNTARALERRGLAEITGRAFMSTGSIIRVTDAGRRAYREAGA